MKTIVAYSTGSSKVKSIIRCEDYSGMDPADPDIQYYTISEAEAGQSEASIAALFATKTAPDKLNMLKEAQKSQVSRYRAVVESQGVAFAFYDGSGTLQTDPVSIRNIQSLVTKALISKSNGDTSRVFGFRDMEDVTHPMTASEVINMGLTATDFINWSYSTSWTKKAEITALSSEANVRAYSITNGWTYTPSVISEGDDTMVSKAKPRTGAVTATSASEKVCLYGGSADGQETTYAATGSGSTVIYKNNSLFRWTIKANGSDAIDGAAAITLAPTHSLMLLDSAPGKWSMI